MVADSPDEVRVRAREQLMQGATPDQADGGRRRRVAAQPARRLDLHAEGAPRRGRGGRATGAPTWRCTPTRRRRSSGRSLPGVKVIEHGHLMDEATAQLMAEKGIWLSTQPFVDDVGFAFPPGSEQAAKLQEVITGTDNVYGLAKKYGIKTAFGTDILFSEAMAKQPGRRARRAGALVHPGRGAGDGDLDERRTAARSPACATPIPAGSAWSRKARWPTCCWSRATRSRTSTSSPTRAELPGHHEGRQDLQELARRVAAGAVPVRGGSRSGGSGRRGRG